MLTLSHLLGPFFQSLHTISIIILVLTALLHILFAAGIAKDVGHLNRLHIPTQIVSGGVWVLATLIGGVLVVGLYWLIHHSALARNFTLKHDNG